MNIFEKFSEFYRRLTLLFGSRHRFERELDEEMRLHRDLRAREIQAEGLSPQEAKNAAQRRFGNALLLQERVHEAGGWLWLENLLGDARYALRRLRNAPGFTAVAIITLALGIGANTAVYTLVHAIMLQSLPVTRPNELWNLGDDKKGAGGGGFTEDVSAYSYQEYLYLRDNTVEFSSLAAFQPGGQDINVRRLSSSQPPEHYRGELVSGNYFQTLGVSAVAGRTLMPSDDQPNSHPVAVMSYRTWHDHFASDRSVVGETLSIKGVPVTVVGITPPGFFGETLNRNPPDFWLPLHDDVIINGEGAELNRWNDFWLYSIGRLRQGFAPKSVGAHVTAEVQQWLRDNYSDPRYVREIPRQHVILTSAAAGVGWIRNNAGNALMLLMAAAGLVLLIACANIANLLLVRGAGTQSQTAVRLALGASRKRIVQQSLVEGVLLAFLGGAAGLWVAMAVSHFILKLAFRGADYVPIKPDPSWPILGFAFALSLLTGIAFSVVPAWIASRTQPADPLRGAGRSGRTASSRSQKLMLVLQACLALVLLMGAGLLAQSLRRLKSQDFGFQTEGRLILTIARLTQYTPEQLPALYQRLQQQLTSVPGVQSASMSLFSPMDWNGWDEPISINGKEIVHPLEHSKWPSQNRVSAHYFETIGTRILRGRAIEEQDTAHSQHVAVVSEGFARTFFPGQDAMGQHFGIEEPAHSNDYEIVGITEDTKYGFPNDRPDPIFFLPLSQSEGAYEDPAQAAEQRLTHYIGSIQLRVAGVPGSYDQPVRQVLADVDPNLTITAMRTLSDQLAINLSGQHLLATLTSGFGLLALLLASIGLYGVVAYTIARRANEIGIRMALGADRVNVVKMVLTGAMKLIVLGLLIGIPVALLGGRAIASQLFGVRPYDPLILGASVLTLLACAAVAALLPARRAAAIDPMIALRAE